MGKFKSTKLEDAIRLVSSGTRVFVHGAAATPNLLLAELAQQASRLNEVTLIHLHTHGPALYADSIRNKTFRVENLFVGENLRSHLDYDRIDYLPSFLSEIPMLFRSGRIPIDAALLHISPPDRAGFCSLGVSVDVAKAAADCAKLLIAQVNPQMPRVHGDGQIHVSRFHALVDVDEALPEVKIPSPGESEKSIARFVAGLIDNGSTLQMGIGSIPNAVLSELGQHQDLGLHTEMWSDGALPLLEKGVISNAQKSVHRGKSVSGFVMGSRKVYDFIDDNPSVIQLEMDYVNNPNLIARNPKVVAINSAVELDLTGQVCADSVGHHVISGVGGQMDFMRGAALSAGGKPIIALNSVTKNGESKIVAALKNGAGVVTTRAHVHYVVTEYGVALLHGKTIRERARALINIAHPRHRERLEREFWENHRRAN